MSIRMAFITGLCILVCVHMQMDIPTSWSNFGNEENHRVAYTVDSRKMKIVFVSSIHIFKYYKSSY
jgi:hypothetical protein